MEETKKKLFADLQSTFETGTEEEIRNFLATRVNEFPDDIKEEIVFAFFEEGLDRALEKESTSAAFQKASLEELSRLGELKRKIDDRIKTIELEGNLKD